MGLAVEGRRRDSGDLVLFYQISVGRRDAFESCDAVIKSCSTHTGMPNSLSFRWGAALPAAGANQKCQQRGSTTLVGRSILKRDASVTQDKGTGLYLRQTHSSLPG